MLSSNDIEAMARIAYLPLRIAVGDLLTMRLISELWRRFGRQHHVRMGFVKALKRVSVIASDADARKPHWRQQSQRRTMTVFV